MSPRPLKKRATLAGTSTLVRYMATHYRVLVSVGLVLTYIWRWHDFHPLFVALRLGAIFTVSSWLFLILQPKTGVILRALGRPYGIFFILWTVWMLLGVPTALIPELAWAFWYDFHFKNVLLFLFLASTLFVVRNIHILVLANIVGMSVGIFFYIKSGMPQSWTPYSMYDRNDLALLFNMTIPVAVWAGVSLKERWARNTAWVILLTGVASVIGTQSRGGLLALSISSAFLLVRFKGISVKAKFAFVASIAVLLLMAPDSYWDRMATMLNPSEDYNMTSDTGRMEIWKRAITYTKDYWVFGLGASNFSIAEATIREGARLIPGARGHVTHNSFLQVASETGIPGVTFFLGTLLGCFWGLFRTRSALRRTKDPELEGIAELCDLVTLCLIAYMVGGFFLSQGYFSYLMVLMALVAGLQYTGEDGLKRWKAERRAARMVPPPGRRRAPASVGVRGYGAGRPAFPAR